MQYDHWKALEEYITWFDKKTSSLVMEGPRYFVVGVIYWAQGYIIVVARKVGYCSTIRIESAGILCL